MSSPTQISLYLNQNFIGFHLNQRAKVKLTPQGLAHLRKKLSAHAYLPEMLTDDDGFYHANIGTLFMEFWPMISPGGPMPFEDGLIWVEA